MQFNHPNILYALFALIIPILVHLFQLRKFEKVPFTNVKFLQQIILQTRKSSKLKKWLTLITRLFALAAIIIAFAEPYFGEHNKQKESTSELVIYLDNSFSMQAKGSSGELLNRAIQNIIKQVPEERIFTLFTNSNTFKNVSLKEIKNDLITLEFSTNQLSYESVFLKANQLFSEKNTEKRLLLISDFQQKQTAFNLPKELRYKVNIVKLTPQYVSNNAIEDVFIKDEDATTITLGVKATNTLEEETAISLFGNDVLLGKATLTDETIAFQLNKGQTIVGKLTLEDNSLQFDNEFYFSINEPEKINVLAISETADATFLQRIYTEEEFNFSASDLTNVDYNLIPKQDLIVLNELNNIPQSLTNILQTYIQNGLHVIVIPSENIDINSYNKLINVYGSAITNLARVTKINYAHPVYKNVFEKEVANFQYPTVESHYRVKNVSANILTFENSDPFLFNKGTIYGLAAAINNTNATFKNSPLIVPSFYNIAKASYKIPALYYTIGEEQRFEVRTQLSNDEILQIKQQDEAFIPLQQTKSNSVVITTNELPEHANNYTITKDNTILKHISYNYETSESDLKYHDMSTFTNELVTVSDDLSITLSEINSKNQISTLWKWFLIFALLFLVIELLLLKYLK